MSDEVGPISRGIGCAANFCEAMAVRGGVLGKEGVVCNIFGLAWLIVAVCCCPPVCARRP